MRIQIGQLLVYSLSAPKRIRLQRNSIANEFMTLVKSKSFADQLKVRFLSTSIFIFIIDIRHRGFT